MVKRTGKVVCALIALVQSENTLAFDQGMAPGMIALGPFDLTPQLNVTEKYDDNIFNRNTIKKASLVTLVGSGGELALRRKLDRYALRYSFLSSQYHSSPADDYIDHNFGGNAHFDLTSRHRLDLSAGLAYGHNMRGTFFSQGFTASQLKEPDQFHTYQSALNYNYGNAEGRGKLSLAVNWSQISYDNHRERTAQWDSTQYSITPGLYFRLRPKIYLTAEIENTFVNYINDSNTVVTLSAVNNPISFRLQDYSARRYLVGVSWEYSARVQNTWRIGYLQQEYSGAVQQGLTGLTFDSNVQWRPLSFDVFSLNMSRNVQSSIGLGSAREVQLYRLGWQHEWAHRITSQLSLSYQEATSQGAGGNNARGMSFVIDVKYQMRPSLNVGLSYLQSSFQYETNDAANGKNVIMLSITYSPSST